MAVDLTIAWGAEELHEMHGEQGFFYVGRGCSHWPEVTTTKRWFGWLKKNCDGLINQGVRSGTMLQQ